MSSESIDFYLGAASGSERKALRKMEAERAMISYATMHCQPIETVENHFYDSGAYSLFAPESEGGRGLEKYPWSIDEYLGFMKWANPEKYAVMDFVCEPNVRNAHDWSVQRQQRKTVENSRKILQKDNELKQEDDSVFDSDPVVVIQGWKPRQYIRHIEMLEDEGLLTDTVGIGSICGRKNTGDIKKVVNTVASQLPKKKLHGFGVKADGFQYPSVRENLDSADSLASSMSVRYSVSGVSPQWWKQISCYQRFYDKIYSYFDSRGFKDIDDKQQRLKEVEAL